MMMHTAIMIQVTWTIIATVLLLNLLIAQMNTSARALLACLADDVVVLQATAVCQPSPRRSGTQCELKYAAPTLVVRA
mgnify:CR=1 FL=1